MESTPPTDSATRDADPDPVGTAVAGVIAAVMDTEAHLVARDQALVADLGVDSLSMIEVLIGVERELGVRTPDEQVERLVTVGDVVEFCRSRTRQSA